MLQDYSAYGNKQIDLNLAQDFLKIHILIQYNVARCLAQMTKFENQMAAAATYPRPIGFTDPRFAKAGAVANYLKLSRALEYYEGYCWFPANRPLLAGLLSADAFFSASQMGLNKDPGAGLTHGEHSHRIQWHVLMREITDDFKVTCDAAHGWSYTPIELFYHMTHGEPANPATINAWGRAIDSQSNAGWGNPDRVMIDLRQSGLTLIAAALDRRVTKYGGADLLNGNQKKLSPRSQALADEFANIAAAGGVPAALQLKGLFKLQEEVLGQVYAYEKLGFPLSPPPPNSLGELAVNVYNGATGTSPLLFPPKPLPHYVLNKKKVPVVQGAPDQGVKVDKNRIAKSRGGFNLQYWYLPSVGAMPVHASRW